MLGRVPPMPLPLAPRSMKAVLAVDPKRSRVLEHRSFKIRTPDACPRGGMFSEETGSLVGLGFPRVAGTVRLPSVRDVVQQGRIVAAEVGLRTGFTAAVLSITDGLENL